MSVSVKECLNSQSEYLKLKLKLKLKLIAGPVVVFIATEKFWLKFWVTFITAVLGVEQHYFCLSLLFSYQTYSVLCERHKLRLQLVEF